MFRVKNNRVCCNLFVCYWYLRCGTAGDGSVGIEALRHVEEDQIGVVLKARVQAALPAQRVGGHQQLAHVAVVDG